MFNSEEHDGELSSQFRDRVGRAIDEIRTAIWGRDVKSLIKELRSRHQVIWANGQWLSTGKIDPVCAAAADELERNFR